MPRSKPHAEDLAPTSLDLTKLPKDAEVPGLLKDLFKSTLVMLIRETQRPIADAQFGKSAIEFLIKAGLDFKRLAMTATATPITDLPFDVGQDTSGLPSRKEN